MKAREMIERLQQLDPEVEIKHDHCDFNYDIITTWEIASVEEGGYLNYGKILSSRDMSYDYGEDYDQETEEA